MKKFLVISEGQAGDLLLLTPALRCLKRSRDDAHVTLLIIQRRGNEELSGSPRSFNDLLIESSINPLRHNPYIDEMYELNYGGLKKLPLMIRIRAEALIIRSLRRNQYDTAVMAFEKERFITWAFLAGIPDRIGAAGQNLDRLLTQRVSISKRGDNGILGYFTALAAAAGAVCKDNATEIFVSSDDSQWAAEKIEQIGAKGNILVALHPGATGDYKIWPPVRYAELIKRFAEQPGIEPLICHADPFDLPVVNEIRRLAKVELKMVSTPSINRLAAMFQQCGLTITNDSGPRHTAVAAGVPNLALFRRHHGTVWKVYPETEKIVTISSNEECGVCPAGECRDLVPVGKVFGSHCMRVIQVEQVFTRAMNMLHRDGKFK